MIFVMFNAFVAALGFAVIFDVSRSELVYCGIAGLTAEAVYQIIRYIYEEKTVAVLVSAVCVTVLVRILANVRKTPVTVYMISGIIPLVPGGAVYNTVFDIIASDYAAAVVRGIDAVKSASAVAIGIVLVLALPNKLFLSRQRKNTI